MEVGSSVTTSSTSWAARTKLVTPSPMPAAVSMISTSMLSLMSLKAWIRPACCWVLRRTMLAAPEEAGTMRMPPGPGMMTSRSSHSPSITSARLRLGASPSMTSTLARPRSASSSITRRPRSARARDRLTATLVFPTPPLPPVTAITCTGCKLPMFSPLIRQSGPTERSRSSRAHPIGQPLPQFLTDATRRGVVVVEAGKHVGHQILAGILGHLQAHRPAYQLMAARRVQIVRNARPVRQVGQRQPLADQHAENLAKAHGLVELGDHATGQPAALVVLVGSTQHLLLAGGRHHQIVARLELRGRQRVQLLTQGGIGTGQSRGVDQHQLLLLQRLQGLAQRLARLHLHHRHVEDLAEGLE